MAIVEPVIEDAAIEDIALPDERDDEDLSFDYDESEDEDEGAFEPEPVPVEKEPGGFVNSYRGLRAMLAKDGARISLLRAEKLNSSGEFVAYDRPGGLGSSATILGHDFDGVPTLSSGAEFRYGHPEEWQFTDGLATRTAGNVRLTYRVSPPAESSEKQLDAEERLAARANRARQDIAEVQSGFSSVISDSIASAKAATGKDLFERLTEATDRRHAANRSLEFVHCAANEMTPDEFRGVRDTRFPAGLRAELRENDVWTRVLNGAKAAAGNSKMPAAQRESVLFEISEARRGLVGARRVLDERLERVGESREAMAA